MEFLGISEEEYYVNQWLGSTGHYLDLSNIKYNFDLKKNSSWVMHFGNYFIIVDSDFNALGIIAPSENMHSATITAWYGDIIEMAEKTQEDFKRRLGDSANHFLTIDGTKKYQEWNDGRGVAASFPILLDGKPLPQDSFISTIEVLSTFRDLHENPEESLYEVAFAEIYNPVIGIWKINNKMEFFRQALLTGKIEFQPDGISTYSLYEKDDTFELRVAFDKDLNVLGYMIQDPYDYS